MYTDYAQLTFKDKTIQHSKVSGDHRAVISLNYYFKEKTLLFVLYRYSPGNKSSLYKQLCACCKCLFHRWKRSALISKLLELVHSAYGERSTTFYFTRPV